MPDDAAARIAVLGGGAWGTVLARLLTANAHDVRLWCRRPERAAEVERAARHARRGGPRLEHGRLRPTHRLEEALDQAEAALVAVPSRAYPAVADAIGARGPVPVLVSCAKGFIDTELRRLSQALEPAGDAVAVLSGPNLADEIAAGLPAAATVACSDDRVAQRLQRRLTTRAFRVDRSEDVIGVEVSGAFKDVIALAAGMAAALGLGHTTHAALITSGLAELSSLGGVLGGDPRTFSGLSGLGDLVATCASSASRNHQVGARIARGESVASIEASGITADGLHSVRHVVRYARRHHLDLPICSEVEAVIDHGKPPRAAIEDLLRRPRRAE